MSTPAHPGPRPSGLYVVKPWFVRRLARIEDVLVARRIPADALTGAGLGASVLGGAAVAAGGMLDAPALWLAVAPLGVVRLALNALDGAVARRTGTARPFGLALNELGDRLGDAALIGAPALLGMPALAAAAVASAFLTSFTGILGHALGGGRVNRGPMGKADRVAVFGIAGMAAAATGDATPFGAALAVIAAGCLVTTVTRLRALAAMGR